MSADPTTALIVPVYPCNEVVIRGAVTVGGVDRAEVHFEQVDERPAPPC